MREERRSVEDITEQYIALGQELMGIRSRNQSGDAEDGEKVKCSNDTSSNATFGHYDKFMKT